MSNVPEKSERDFQPFVWLGIAAAFVSAVWLATPAIVSRWAPPSASEPRAVGEFSDQFGVTASLFTALAFAALVVTIWQQQKGLAQQREELKLQRDELRLQREELRRSVAEMEKSADAQTAQVKLGALSAQLASLPVLIHEEESRLTSLRDTAACRRYNEKLLSRCTVDDLKLDLDTVEASLKASPARVEQLHAEIADLEARLDEEERSVSDKEARDPSLTHFRVGPPSGLLGELDSKLKNRKIALEDCERAVKVEKRLSLSLQGLIALRQELAGTYEQMKAFRKWREPNGQDSGQVADSDS